jgi:hypothetical protein
MPFFWNSAKPSSTVKTAPHFGHLIFASFEIPAHPKEKTAKTANAKKILTHFLITIHLLSSIFKKLSLLIETIFRRLYICLSKNPRNSMGEIMYF